jgi:predicted small metal-binding protein
MPKSLSCKDVGMNCDWKTQGQTEDEVLKKASEHARTVHKMNQMPPEMQQKVRGAIRDVR